MSDMTPIRMDANGMGTFEKTEIIVRQELEPQKSPQLPFNQQNPSDQLRLTKKMRKYLEKKTTLIKQQVYTPAQQVQHMQQKNSSSPAARLPGKGLAQKLTEGS